uniref:Uncharacterized protein n=1 Tax=Cyanothece sp. (strain PCC 7425 / ATCC 29141) TaxID=395961 RepID=B8HN15_CYAP4
MYDISAYRHVLIPVEGKREEFYCPNCGAENFKIGKGTPPPYNCFSGLCKPEQIRAAIDLLAGKELHQNNGRPKTISHAEIAAKAITEQVAATGFFDKPDDWMPDRESGQPQQADSQDRDRAFDDLIQRLHQIFTKSESPSKQRWELAKLAKSVKLAIGQLTALYNDWRAEQEEISPVDLAQFRASCSEKREWLIGGVLPKATTGLLHSDAGTGKTLLLYCMALAIALGIPWNGFPTAQGKVLIVQTDEPSSETKERFEIAGFFEKVPPGQISILTRWGFSQIYKLRRWIEHHQPALVVIDSLTTANRHSRSEEKDAPYAHGLLDLRDIADQYGCTIWVLHHSNRQGGLRGSTAIDASVSEVWKLRKPEKSEGHLSPLHRVLEIGKSRAECSGHYLLKLEPEDYSWEWEGDYDSTGESKPRSSAPLLEFLNRNPGIWFEPEELAGRGFGGGSRDAVRKQCDRLARKGLIESEQRVKQRETGATRYKVYRSSLDSCNQSIQRDVQRENPLPVNDPGSLDASSTGYKDSSADCSPTTEQENTMLISSDQASSENQTQAQQSFCSLDGSLDSVKQSVQRGGWIPQPGDRVRYRGQNSLLKRAIGEKVLTLHSPGPDPAYWLVSVPSGVSQTVPLCDLSLVRSGA